QALIRFAIKPNRESRSVIRKMAHLFFTCIEPPIPDVSLRDSKGVYIDLQELYHRTNTEYFKGELSLPIAWFPIPRYRKFRQITFGSYDFSLSLVRINRILDHASVPVS